MEKQTEEYLGCGSSSCYIQKKTGQNTNGGCTCFGRLEIDKVIKLRKAIDFLGGPLPVWYSNNLKKDLK